jgi:hypothetical protein
MVTALRAVGGTVKYSLLKGAPHNLPPDFDQQAVISWYLRQTRSHKPAPADPLDALGIGALGFSETAIVTLPGGWFWKSATVPTQSAPDRRSANSDLEKLLFRKVEDRGALVDGPIHREIDLEKQVTTLWLGIPNSIPSELKDDTSIIRLADRKAARFYCRVDNRTALARANEVSAKLKSEGKGLRDAVWLTSLTPQQRGSNHIAECWIELK